MATQAALAERDGWVTKLLVVCVCVHAVCMWCGSQTGLIAALLLVSQSVQLCLSISSK